MLLIFFQDFTIKTSEHTISIKKEYDTLYSEEAIRNHRQKYKYLHIGLIQIAVKPLHRLGLDSPILLCLRDSRYKNFQNSLLAIMESNLADDPVYCNCYPNFSVDLSDPNIFKTLTLNIQQGI